MPIPVNRRSIASLIAILSISLMVASCSKKEAEEYSPDYQAACQGPPLRKIELREKALSDGYAINWAFDCIDKASFVAIAEHKSKLEAAKASEAIAENKALQAEKIPEEQAIKATGIESNKAAPLPGALSISADGRTAVYIDTNGDVVLWDAATVKPLETIPSDGNPPSAVALSSDGKDVVLLDAASIKPLETISSKGNHPSAVALSPDGDFVAIGYIDSRVIVWSRREHKLLREFNGHTGGVPALAFSLDGQMLASGGGDGTTQLWEVSTGRQLRVFDSQFGGSDRGGIPVSLGFSDNGRALVVNEWYSRFYDVGRGTTLWDIEKGIEISTRDVAPPNGDNVMRAGQALGGGSWLLAYTGRKGLMAERLDLCESPRQMPSGHYAETVSADPQGRWVAATEYEQLTFFGMSGDTKSYAITLPARAIALAAHPDGHSVIALMIAETRPNGNKNFIIGRDAETVTGSALYRIAVPAPLWGLPPMAVKADAAHCPPPDAVRTVQDFRLSEKLVGLTVTAKLEPTQEMTTDAKNPTGEYNQINPPRELYFAPNGNLYALYNANSNFRSGVAVWNLQTKRLLRARFKQYIGDFTFRLQEGWGEASGTLNNLLTGKPLYSLRNDERQDSSTVTSDRDTGEVYRLVTDHFERYGADGQRLKDITTSGTVTAFAARNGRFAALYSDGNIQVWPLQRGGKSKTSMLLPPQNENGGCGAIGLELSADGNYAQIHCDQGPDAPTAYVIYSLHSAKQVAGGEMLTPFPARSNRGVVQDTRPHHLAVWDFDKGKIIARLPRHPSRDKNGAYKPLRAAFSDDGRLLASASYDGLVRVWDLNARQVVGEASLGGAVTAMVFDSAGRQLAVGRADGQLLVLQVPAQSKQ